MYITTSRNPAGETRRFCRMLAGIIPGAIFENRGRKGIDKVAERARGMGKARALLVYEKNGRPCMLSFMEIGRGWRWLRPEIEVTEVRGRGAGAAAEGAVVEGENAGAVGELFAFEPVECEEDVLVVHAGRDAVSFSVGGKQILLMKVVYR